MDTASRPVDLDHVYRLVDAYERGHLTWEQVREQVHGTTDTPARLTVSSRTTEPEPTDEPTQRVGEDPPTPTRSTLGIATNTSPRQSRPLNRASTGRYGPFRTRLGNLWGSLVAAVRRDPDAPGGA